MQLSRCPQPHTSFVNTILGLLIGACAVASPAWAQIRIDPQNKALLPPRATKEVNLSGPRFGMTMLSPGTVAALEDNEIFLQRPLVMQFGWQFEKRLYTTEEGLTALTEFVPLISGLEQGVALPSLNWLVGIRTPQGTEFGIGPNITPIGVGLVVAGGVTVRTGALNVPINVAIASSKSGMRVSILTGFNLRR